DQGDGLGAKLVEGLVVVERFESLADLVCLRGEFVCAQPGQVLGDDQRLHEACSFGVGWIKTRLRGYASGRTGSATRRARSGGDASRWGRGRGVRGTLTLSASVLATCPLTSVRGAYRLGSWKAIAITASKSPPP